MCGTGPTTRSARAGCHSLHKSRTPPPRTRRLSGAPTSGPIPSPEASPFYLKVLRSAVTVPSIPGPAGAAQVRAFKRATGFDCLPAGDPSEQPRSHREPSDVNVILKGVKPCDPDRLPLASSFPAEASSLPDFPCLARPEGPTAPAEYRLLFFWLRRSCLLNVSRNACLTCAPGGRCITKSLWAAATPASARTPHH